MFDWDTFCIHEMQNAAEGMDWLKTEHCSRRGTIYRGEYIYLTGL